MRVAVVGAGPAGLTAAYELTKSTPHVDLYEASESVGGLARSLQLWGQTVDLGPHRFFSRDRRVNKLWLEVVGSDYAMVRRLTRILYNRQFFNYPLRPIDTLTKLGVAEAARCAASFAWGRIHPVANSETFESWMVSRFGRRLYEIFFKSYSEKLWGIPCHELDADFAAQRIKQFSLLEAAKLAFRASPSAKHRTLCDEFAYPLEGTGVVYRRMANTIEERGGHVHLGTPVYRVLTQDGRCRALELENNTVREYDAVISSMPLTHLVERLDEAPPELKRLASQLAYRNTVLVYFEVSDTNICQDNWLYVQEPFLKTGRITNFRNWVPELCGKSRCSILAMEYWCNFDDELWKSSDTELIEIAKVELMSTSLIRHETLLTNATVYRLPRCYPVYRRGYREIVASIRAYLSTISGLHVIGRYGAFKYNNQDHSILMGSMAAENILQRGKNDLWGVNADYDSYQESCRITQSGLVAVR